MPKVARRNFGKDIVISHCASSGGLPQSKDFLLDAFNGAANFNAQLLRIASFCAACCCACWLIGLAM